MLETFKTMDITNLKSKNINEWPKIWCELNAKDMNGFPSHKVVMDFIEDEFEIKSLLKYWNEIFIPSRKKKRKVLSKMFD